MPARWSTTRPVGKLKTPKHPNPPEEWVRTPEAFDGVIEFELFLQAQEILEKRKAAVRSGLHAAACSIRCTGLTAWCGRDCCGWMSDCRRRALTSRQFGSLDQAFQKLFDGERDQGSRESSRTDSQPRPRGAGLFRLLGARPEADAFRFNRRCRCRTATTSYWPLRCDTRPVIDLTLGVLLSEPADFNILGFVALPRFGSDSKPIRFTSSSTRTELFGRTDLQFLEQLL